MVSTPLAAGLTLFAVEPTWTDKEIIGVVGSTVAATVGAMVALCGIAYRSLTSSLRAKLRETERELRETRDGIKDLGDLDVVRTKLAEYDGVKGKLSQAEKQVGSLTTQLIFVQEECDGYRAVIHGLTGERDALKERCATIAAERDEVQGELKAEQNKIKKAVQRDGAIWTDPVLAAKKVEFRPLDPDVRRMPIISMLNLKGGVGKTTVTANLASALAHRGYRVLLIDLDLQGSLTGMFLDEKEQERLYKENRLVGNFLEASFDAEFPNLMDYVHQLPGFPTKCQLVPTTDAQSYAEMNLTVRWFLKDSTRDPRFLLRKELQLARVTNRFDVVLIDCPPLLNVSCSNALAASDYVMVPVMPSGQSTARVPVLLERLKEIREAINPDLKVLGVFANRTRGAELTADESNRLDELRGQCRDAWGEKVHVFESFIRQATAIRDCEDERRTLGPDDEFFKTFAALAQEVEDGFPTFARPPAAKITSEVSL